MTGHSDSRIIIAGGGQGIGAATALKLTAEGAHVEIWDIAEKEANELVDVIRDRGGNAEYRAVDVFDYPATEAAVTRFVDTHGRLDGMMCTVGGGLEGAILDIDGAFFERQIRLNLLSVFNTARAAAAPMKDQRYGRIVVFTSTTGGLPGMASYGAGKAGVESLLQSFHAELGEFGIGINAILPSLTVTEMTLRYYRENKLEHVMEEYVSKMPFGANTPEEIADIAVYLLSEAARRVTNSVVRTN